MAAPRLPFLWPFLYRTAIDAAAPSVRSARSSVRRRALHSTSGQGQHSAVPQRYGSANEPPPHLGGRKSIGPGIARQRQAEEQQQQEPKPLPKIGDQLQRDGEREVEAESKAEGQREARAEQAPPKPDQQATAASRTIREDPMMDSLESIPLSAPRAPLDHPPDKPVEALLLNVPDHAPQSTYHTEEAESGERPQTMDPHPAENTAKFQEEHAPSLSHPPHIDAPRYVHHFDTYGLVKRLTDAGWDHEQAITMMKVTRLILAENMDLAKDALVSKSMVENEGYLFKAACSEVRTEVNARRKAEEEAMRTARSQVQHEVEILSQRVGQEAVGLKDELKGMFDDRKLAVRGEQRDMESKVQQLNYKITVSLQADAKSDVEALRWVMTRRVMVALGSVVLMVVTALKVFANMTHEAEMEAKRAASRRSGGTQTMMSGEDRAWGQMGDGGGGGSKAGEMLVKEGDNPAFVSLG